MFMVLYQVSIFEPETLRILTTRPHIHAPFPKSEKKYRFTLFLIYHLVFGRPKHRCEENTKVDHEEIGRESVH
jgi:hypothetical protein